MTIMVNATRVLVMNWGVMRDEGDGRIDFHFDDHLAVHARSNVCFLTHESF